jgi:hypothetical protein
MKKAHCIFAVRFGGFGVLFRFAKYDNIHFINLTLYI